MSKSLSFFWHRRDLRLHDNAGLYKALKSETKVQPVFIFDSDILQELDSTDFRLPFIHDSVSQLKEAYQSHGSDLWVFVGKPKDVWSQLLQEHQVDKVFTNRDYEPYARQRDEEIGELIARHGIDFIGAKDHVIFEKNEVVKADGTPYLVFTPYSKKWRELCKPFHVSSYPCEKYFSHLASVGQNELPTLSDLGFERKPLEIPSTDVSDGILLQYAENRDFPAKEGTSKLGVHLRFGTISIRELAKRALETNHVFTNELIWRDFYQMILFHFPDSPHISIKPKYDRIVWENNMDHFEKWKEGKTGYPMVDAGMRELNATGYMHNRVRMVVASFLTKHLLLDWRLGERYFASKLLDYDLAANVGGWQWASGSGCDAAPYFRIFNPTEQLKKFDPELKYVKKWIPEWGTSRYPDPIVVHEKARARALARYKEGLK